MNGWKGSPTPRDHVVLTFVVARVHERDPITRNLFEELRDIGRRLADPRLEAAVAMLTPIGRDTFAPRDRDAFLKLVDTVRFEIHRFIEKEWGLSEIPPGRFADRDLLTACVTDAFWVESAREEWEDGIVRREVVVRAEDGWGAIRVEDDTGEKVRRVFVDVSARHDCEVRPRDLAERYLEEHRLSDPHAYLYSFSRCRAVLREGPEGIPRTEFECELDVLPVIEGSTEFGLEELRDAASNYCDVEAGKEPGVLKLRCDYDFKREIRNDTIDGIIEREIGVEGLANRMCREEISAVVESVKNAGAGLSLDCEFEFAYPHIGGVAYYVWCRGSGEFPLGPEGVAESLDAIHSLLERIGEAR